MQNQKVLILNFGGQYDQLIGRRVRECSVYCEVKSYTMTLSEIRASQNRNRNVRSSEKNLSGCD